MKKFSIPGAAVTAVVTTFVLAPAALAHANDYDYSTTSSAASTSFALGFWIFLLFLVAFGIAITVFWVVMLIDALQRKNWRDDSQKNLWIILLIGSFFVSMTWLAAVVYYFAIRKALGKASPGPAAVEEATVVPPQAKPTEPAEAEPVPAKATKPASKK